MTTVMQCTCGRKFASKAGYDLHRERKEYDLWRVKGQTGMLRVPVGELPKETEATRVTTGNVSWRCHDPRQRDQVIEKGTWYTGLTPSQKRRAREFKESLREKPGDGDAEDPA